MLNMTTVMTSSGDSQAARAHGFCGELDAGLHSGEIKLVLSLTQCFGMVSELLLFLTTRAETLSLCHGSRSVAAVQFDLIHTGISG